MADLAPDPHEPDGSLNEHPRTALVLGATSDIGAAILGDGRRAAVAGLDQVAEVRGKGLMLAVEFVHPGTVEPDAALTTRVFEACRAGGLLVGKGGLYGNVIRMGPPLTLTEDEAREGLAIMVEAIRASIEA